MHISLKNGAIFIADSHYKKDNRNLYFFLKDIYENKIECSQLFLVGDIFELLIWNFKYLIDYNREVIDLINLISDKIEVFYLEGNHDFLLESLFKKVYIADSVKIGNVVINHGDVFLKDNFYKIYKMIIRNRVILSVLNIITLNFINNWLFKKLLNRKKSKCLKFKDFKGYIQKEKFTYFKDFDILIEGHYHQNVQFEIKDKKYLNLPAFTCNNLYVILKLSNTNTEFVTKEYQNEKR